jgi:hypothetical protein
MGPIDTAGGVGSLLRNGARRGNHYSHIVPTLCMLPRHKLLAQISLDDRFFLHYVARFAAGQHAAVVQYHKVICKPQHRVHSVLDDDDSHPFVTQTTQHVQQLQALLPPKSRQRFIQQQ